MLQKRTKITRKRPPAPSNPRSRAGRPRGREVDRDSLERFEGEGGNQEQFGEKERHDAPAPGRPAPGSMPPG